MAYVVNVKDKNKKLAKKQMGKILDLFGDEIESISGPFDELPVTKSNYKSGELPPALIRAEKALKDEFKKQRRPVSVYEVREKLDLSRNLVSGYLNQLVSYGHAEKVPNTFDVEKANVLFKPSK